MPFSNTKELIVVEVHWLDDVRANSKLRAPAAEAIFRSLAYTAATEVVTEHFMRNCCLGGRCFDGPDDDEGDGARLHVMVSRKGRIYSLLIVGFDHETRNPPLISDGMAIVYGERSLLWKVVAFQWPDCRAIEVELVPCGSQSDEPRISPQPARPTGPPKPVHHCIAIAAAHWWANLKLWIGQGRKALSRTRRFVSLGIRDHALAFVPDWRPSTRRRKWWIAISSLTSVVVKRFQIEPLFACRGVSAPVGPGAACTMQYYLAATHTR